MRNKKLIFGIFLLVSILFMIIPKEGNGNVLYFSFEFDSERKSNDYWIYNQGFVDEIEFKVITQEEIVISALCSGDIDIIGQFINIGLLRPDDYKNPDIAVVEGRS